MLASTQTKIATMITNADTGAKGLQALALRGLTVAQRAFNVAVKACPIIMIISLVIMGFKLIIGIVNKVTGKTISALGLITGGISAAATIVVNIGKFIANRFIDAFVMIHNGAATVVNGVVAGFSFLADKVLLVIQKIAEAIDFVFGSNLADSVQGWRDDLPKEDVIKKLNAKDYYFEYGNVKDSFNKGYDFGSNLENKLKDFFKTDDGTAADPFNTNDWADALGDTALNTGNIAGDTKSIKNSVQANTQELAYLREIMTRQAISKYTSATVTVNVGGMNTTINNDQDVDGLLDKMTTAISQAVSVSPAGVHL